MSDPERIAGRDVAEDMAALFGSGVRPSSAAPVRPLPATSRRGRRGIALGAAGLAVAAIAGVLAGTSAVGPVATTPAATARGAARAVAPQRVALATPAAVPSVELAADPAPPQWPEEAEARAVDLTPVAASSPLIPARSAPPTATRRFAAPAAMTAPHVVARPTRVAATARVAPMARAAPAQRTAAAQDERCLDDRYCAGQRLYDADGEVAAAYAEATTAGVSAKLLRGYRGEWLRARRVGRNRPREAMRVYGMVAADLHMLAEDAGAEDAGAGTRSAWR